jgi:hypothetical protein
MRAVRHVRFALLEHAVDSSPNFVGDFVCNGCTTVLACVTILVFVCVDVAVDVAGILICRG